MSANRFSPLDMIRKQQEENKYRTDLLDLREIQEHPRNDFPISESDIETLADSILKSGGILQFPLVRLLKDGTYQMLAGHRRRKASLLLGERVDESYYKTLCYVLEDLSDERAELYLIETNIQARALSPKLRAKKVADARELIETLKNRGELDIRSVRKAVAEMAGISESNVILQSRIAEKLDRGLMELYDKGAFTTREAYNFSGLTAESQEQILKAYQELLDPEDLKQEIRRITIQEHVGVGKSDPRHKEAESKINQAYKRLSDLTKLKEAGVSLDEEALLKLQGLLNDLLQS